MGNCCAKDSTSPGAFQGEGRRLGSANDEAPATSISHTNIFGKDKKSDDLPKPRQDPNMTDEERAKQRFDRLAAAEARQKKQGGPPKKKKANTDAPLTGPNTQPLMRWTAG